MKTKIISFFFFMVLAVSMANAQQPGHRRFDFEDFKKKKYEFIKKEIGLTEKEAKAFLPLSDELMKKKFEINKELRDNIRTLREKKEKSDADYEKMVDKALDARIKEAQLEKEYYQKFKKVLSGEKLYKYQMAEMKFNKNMVNNRERAEREKRK